MYPEIDSSVPSEIIHKINLRMKKAAADLGLTIKKIHYHIAPESVGMDFAVFFIDGEAVWLDR
jgi:hypothetical protein